MPMGELIEMKLLKKNVDRNHRFSSSEDRATVSNTTYKGLTDRNRQYKYKTEGEVWYTMHCLKIDKEGVFEYSVCTIILIWFV